MKLKRGDAVNFILMLGSFYLLNRSMDNLFLKRVNSWQGLVKKEQESIFVK